MKHSPHSLLRIARDYGPDITISQWEELVTKVERMSGHDQCYFWDLYLRDGK